MSDTSFVFVEPPSSPPFNKSLLNKAHKQDSILMQPLSATWYHLNMIPELNTWLLIDKWSYFLSWQIIAAECWLDFWTHPVGKQ